MSGAAASYRSGTVGRSVFVRSDPRNAWDRVSRIMELEAWVSGVERTRALPGARSGVGAGRAIVFEDGKTVTERVVGWRRGAYFSYIMIDGLPLRSYHATISVGKKTLRGTRVSWRSYFGSKKSTRSDFGKTAAAIGTLYSSSLDRLKKLVEGGA